MDFKTLQKTVLAIPSINGGRLLARMLPTLQIPGELVIVLDQGSTDDTEEICRAAGVDLVQLGRPHTYTEACNIGAEIARERACDYLFVANNDIALTTDVIRALLAELIADPNLGIVAPGQIIISETGSKHVAYRVAWNLEKLTFLHDFNPPACNTRRLEADFCELTLAGVRMSVIDEIGFLDNKYGFYHEDADFGFRVRQAGYTCAYLPNVQIEHWSSSSFSSSPELKSDYLSRNKQLFASKFLGRYVAHADHKSNETTSWNIINKNLHPYLRKHGLINPDYPDLIFAHPGTPPFDHLFTIWETSRLPSSWLVFKDRYKLTMTPSHWGIEVLKDAGFARVHYVPLGVETDVFQPWGTSQRFGDGKTFLWFARNQYRKGLDVMLGAWHAFHRARPDARLILMGVGILDAMDKPDGIRIWKHFRIGEYRSESISVHESTGQMDEETLATIYRSVDFTVCSSRAEGFGFSIAESMACGTPAIFGNFSAMKEFATDGALLMKGARVSADYSDKGFVDVGDWWEPSVEHLTALLLEANDMDGTRYQRLAQDGIKLIRTKFSWHATSFAIRAALIAEDQGRIPAERTSPLFAKTDLVKEPPTDEPEVPVQVREWIGPALASPDLVLDAQPPAQPHSGVVVDRPVRFGDGTEVTSVRPAYLDSGSIRWKGFVARNIRRFGILCTAFGEQLESCGLRQAITVCFRDFAHPFFRRRTIWLYERVQEPLLKVRRRLFWSLAFILCSASIIILHFFARTLLG
jgi:GT2 family glycosyltransferase